MNKFIYTKDQETIDKLKEMGLKEVKTINGLTQFALTKGLNLDFSVIDKSKIKISNLMRF